MHSFAPPRPPMQPQITTVTELSLAPESQFCKREYRKENCICVLEVSALRSCIRSHLGNSDLWPNPDALDDGYRSRREVRAERHCSCKRSANRCFRNGQTMVQVTHVVRVPPRKPSLALGVVSLASGCPKKMGQKKEKLSCFQMVRGRNWSAFHVSSQSLSPCT
jgi:hypothetical protein